MIENDTLYTILGKCALFCFTVPRDHKKMDCRQETIKCNMVSTLKKGDYLNCGYVRPGKWRKSLFKKLHANA